MRRGGGSGGGGLLKTIITNSSLCMSCLVQDTVATKDCKHLPAVTALASTLNPLCLKSDKSSFFFSFFCLTPVQWKNEPLLVDIHWRRKNKQYMYSSQFGSADRNNKQTYKIYKLHQNNYKELLCLFSNSYSNNSFFMEVIG